MCIFLQRLDLNNGEYVCWAKVVGNVHLGGRPVGGQLLCTNRRIAFRPIQYERLLRAQGSSIPAEDVDFVDLVPPQTLPANLRSLLRVHLANGEDLLFSFNGIHRALSKIAEVTALRVSFEEDSPQVSKEYPVRSGMEVVIPLLTLGFLFAAISCRLSRSPQEADDWAAFTAASPPGLGGQIRAVAWTHVSTQGLVRTFSEIRQLAITEASYSDLRNPRPAPGTSICLGPP